jgi:hypothetical protein
MGEKEREIIDEVLLEGSYDGRLFRANSGMGYQGKNIQHLRIGKNEKGIVKKIINSLISFLKKINIRFKNLIILINIRVFHGMPEGTPDIIGWKSIEICEWLNENMQKHPCRIYKNKKNEKKSCELCPFHKKIAIFRAVEIKTGKLKLTPEQKRYKKILLEHGGIYEEKREI